jgi:hypothetical protein
VTVYEAPGLHGLELWNAVSRNATLFRLRDRKSEYFAGLCDVLLRLHAGQISPELHRAAGFQQVIFCGGEAQHPLLEQTLQQAAPPFAFEIDRTGEFAARRGALRIFEEMGWRRGVALDLGQTQLKVITATECRSLPRDTEWLPLGRSALDAETGRAHLRDFLAGALPADADGVVLGLPVELDRDGIAQSATYPGLWGPVEPIFFELFPMPWVVLNDAVLAAVGFRPTDRKKRLVVTMGFGIGGALWDE